MPILDTSPISILERRGVEVARIVGATLVTHDSHFKHVENLSIVDWIVP